MATRWVHLGTQLVSQFGLLDEDGDGVSDHRNATVAISRLTAASFQEAHELCRRELEALRASETETTDTVAPPAAEGGEKSAVR